MSVSLESALVIVDELLQAKLPSEELQPRDEILIACGVENLEARRKQGIPPRYVVAVLIAALFKLRESDPFQSLEGLQDMLSLLDSQNLTNNDLN